MTLVAVIGMAQSATWPITLTTDNGLPGKKEPQNYVFESGLYKFDEAISTLRMTVVSTNTVDALTASYDGMSGSWGPAFPFFSLSEVSILDASGASINYVATSNALDHGDGGGYDALNDGKHGTHFHTVYGNRGENCPQEYHYIDFEFESPISEFRIKWMTRANYTPNMPTYVGLTPGTQYLPYPEQEFSLGEKVASVEELGEGGLFLIESNVEQYHHFTEGTVDRTYPGGGFFHSPYGAHVTANAASLVYFIPVAGAENTYKVAWLNNGHYIYNSQTNRSEWLNWTDQELAAAPIIFTPCEGENGTVDFGMTTLLADGIERTISADAIGKMAMTVTDSLYVRSRPNAQNFSIWKANVNANKMKFMLEGVLADAKARIALFGFNEVEDNGEYAALTAAVEAADAIMADANATAVQVVNSTNELNTLLPPYVALGIYHYTDSIYGIIEAIEDEEIPVSGADGWVKGTYPEGCDDALNIAADAALMAVESYTCIADIDAAFDAVKAAIASFWASKIDVVYSLPFRVGEKKDNLPGPLDGSYNGYVWESPLYLLNEAVDALRFTVFQTNNGATYKGFVFPTMAEFELYDLQGNKIELTEENFSTNSVNPNDGQGLAGICDNNHSTYWHGAYGDGQDPNSYENNPAYVYIEVTLPEAINGFRYKQWGRGNMANTPTDFAFGYYGVAVTPDDVMFPDPYNAVCGEKITSVDQITDDGIYAIQGLISCDPVNHFEGDLREPHFYTGIKVLGANLQAAGAFNITKTEDGKFNIQSLADGKYWSKSVDEDGWCDGSATLYKAAAADVVIEPMNNDGLPNSFVIYMYDENQMRDGEPHPYLIFQDWGSNIGVFSVTGLDANDKDGEGEWYIYKMTMDTPYYYWLHNLVSAAEAMGLVKSDDPGYYKDLGTFPTVLAQAQAAVEAKDDAACQGLIAQLNAAIAGVESVTPNPVVEATYIIEAAQETFFEYFGNHKAFYVYPNDESSDAVTSAYKLYWGDIENDRSDISDVYKFVFESAKNSDKVQQWIADSVITEAQAEAAFFIKNKYYNVYIGAQSGVSAQLGTTDAPEAVYILRQQLPTKYDIWNPEGANFSLHMQSHNNGAGERGCLVYWTGTAEASHWRLRTVTENTSISDIVVEGDEVVSVTYYTVSGISSNAPIKGAVNIIKTVYANGAVETKKEFIK